MAERRGKVARNVARLSEMPATRRPAARRTLTPEQAVKLLEAASGDRLEGLIVVGLMLGLRPGELTGLRWSDVDVDAGRRGARSARASSVLVEIAGRGALHAGGARPDGGVARRQRPVRRGKDLPSLQ